MTKIYHPNIGTHLIGLPRHVRMLRLRLTPSQTSSAVYASTFLKVRRDYQEALRGHKLTVAHNSSQTNGRLLCRLGRSYCRFKLCCLLLIP